MFVYPNKTFWLDKQRAGLFIDKLISSYV